MDLRSSLSFHLSSVSRFDFRYCTQRWLSILDSLTGIIYSIPHGVIYVEHISLFLFLAPFQGTPRGCFRGTSLGLSRQLDGGTWARTLERAPYVIDGRGAGGAGRRRGREALLVFPREPPTPPPRLPPPDAQNKHPPCLNRSPDRPRMLSPSSRTPTRPSISRYVGDLDFKITYFAHRRVPVALSSRHNRGADVHWGCGICGEYDKG